MKRKFNWVQFIAVSLGVLSIICSFVPGMKDYTAAAFLLSMFTFFSDFYSKTNSILIKTKEHASDMSTNVKNHLIVIKIDGSIIDTFNNYVVNRLHIIQSIKNTSFNLEKDHYEADELFNDTDQLNDAPKKIAISINEGLKWEDVGDNLSATRFKTWDKYFQENSQNGSYTYRFLSNKVPYPNFMIIRYKDGQEEVLFNWDVRSAGNEPEVLSSREPQLVTFYKTQFKLLRDNASSDPDKLD